jgi:hypothetical protein
MSRFLCHFIIFIILLLLIQNCSPSRIPVGEPIDDPTLLERLVNKLDIQYPHTFSLSQRIILNVRGKQYDFLGQLMVEKGKAFRAIAFGEMGGLFLDILHKDSQTSILGNPSSLPEKPLRLGVAKDILQIFDYQGSGASLFRTEQGENGITRSITGEIFYDYFFDKDSGLLQDMYVIEGSSIIKKIQFKNYTEYENVSTPLPSLIIVENLEWHYSMEIHLLTFKPDFDHNKAFQLTGASE